MEEAIKAALKELVDLCASQGAKITVSLVVEASIELSFEEDEE